MDELPGLPPERSTDVHLRHPDLDLEDELPRKAMHRRIPLSRVEEEFMWR